MRSPCEGAALDPRLWTIVPDKVFSLVRGRRPRPPVMDHSSNKALSLSLSLSLRLSGDLEPTHWDPRGVCVCLLLQYLLQSCSRGGSGIVEDI